MRQRLNQALLGTAVLTAVILAAYLIPQPQRSVTRGGNAAYYHLNEQSPAAVQGVKAVSAIGAMLQAAGK